VNRIPDVGFLVTHHHRSNLGGIAHPKFMTTLHQQTFKPLRLNGGFDPDPGSGRQTV
jgi:hypothetical protein